MDSVTDTFVTENFTLKETEFKEKLGLPAELHVVTVYNDGRRIKIVMTKDK